MYVYTVYIYEFIYTYIYIIKSLFYHLTSMHCLKKKNKKIASSVYAGHVKMNETVESTGLVP